MIDQQSETLSKQMRVCNNCKHLETQPMIAYRGMWKEEQYRCDSTGEIILFPKIRRSQDCALFENKWGIEWNQFMENRGIYRIKTKMITIYYQVYFYKKNII